MLFKKSCRRGLQFKVEGSLNIFFGASMKQDTIVENGGPVKMVELHQEGLEGQIIATQGLDECKKMHNTPEKFGTLGKDPDGDPSNGRFSYALVVGML